ncbi:MAG: phosphate signaling complex protein PhoU [bacterium]|nr:phosphate signaling complex protein PhoU [bacterium]
MERHFDGELKSLKEQLLTMGGLVEAMVRQAIEALVVRDATIIEEVIKNEEKVNRLHLEIDELCLQLIALRQPLAIDLRFILASSRISSDMERMGDLAINIAGNDLELLKVPPLKPLIDLPRMAEITQKMVKDSLDAFVRKDTDMAQAVIKRDDEVDALKDQIFRELLTYMMSDSGAIKRALELILISRHLERIADHATNVAEDVIFLVKGKDIRHPRVVH